MIFLQNIVVSSAVLIDVKDGHLVIVSWRSQHEGTTFMTTSQLYRA
jgi:hypothetical protein